MIFAERICNAYGLGRFISSSGAGGSRNACYVFQTGTGKQFVRQRHGAYCHEKRVKFDHEAMLYLARAGLRVKPPLAFKGKEGKNTWWHDGETLWEVFEFIEGRSMRDGNKNDAAFLGKELGIFHRSGAGFDFRYEKLDARGETDPERLLTNAKRLKDADPALAPALEPYERLIGKTSLDFPAKAYLALPHTLVHGDVQPANIIMADKGLNAFVDFDWCAWRPRIYDLAFAILFCCSSHEQPIGKGDIWALTQAPHFNAEATEAFMRAYGKRAGELSGEERKCLGPQIALTWCHARVDGAFKVPEKQRKSFLSRPGPKDTLLRLPHLLNNPEP